MIAIEFQKYDAVTPWFYAFWFKWGIDIHIGLYGVTCSLSK